MANMPQTSDLAFKVVIGIDFGTTGTGIAFANRLTQDVYIEQDFDGSGRKLDIKQPTTILLDENLECVAFGHAAIEKWSENKSVQT